VDAVVVNSQPEEKVMRSRNSIAVVVALAAFMASGASAIELSIRPNWESEGDKLDVGLSTTGVISLYIDISGADDGGDGNVSFMNAFLDATPLNSGDAVGYDVVGNDFKMERNDGSGWFRNEGDSSSRNIEDYSLIAADDDPDFPREQWGTNDPWEGAVDSIIIHGTTVGSYDLYYENKDTAEGAARPPGLFDANNEGHFYARALQIPGFYWFLNAWRDDYQEFDVPFVINVIPEPASLALLAVGGLAILRRRK